MIRSSFPYTIREDRIFDLCYRYYMAVADSITGSIFADRFAVVDTPKEYYTVMSFIDLIVFLYGLNKTNDKCWGLVSLEIGVKTDDDHS